jgi:YidC/Oxa1 family membrane protein insertase
VLIANILEPLVDAEEWLLEGLHSIGLAWGLAIVVLTLVVRTSIVPLTIRQFRAQRELAVHLPELRRLHERHAKDPERLRREIAAYYAEHRVNPLALFLPILVQIPVFLSLYFLMREDVANGLFHHAGFLFIPDLTARPHGAVLAVLVLCYLASQLASSAVATRTLAGKHRKLMLAMPVLFLGVATRFPAALLVYWIVSSLWTLGQQLVLLRTRARAGLDAAANVDDGEQPSGA